MLPLAKLDTLVRRHAEVEAALASGVTGEAYVALTREFAELSPVVAAASAYRRALDEAADLDAILADPGVDREMAALAEADKPAVAQRLHDLEADLRVALLPKDIADAKNAILEVRAGTGGDEASLFAGDLFRMYQRFASLQGWTVEVLSLSEGTVGGYKEIIAEMRGAGAYAKMKFESGVHRVQRVPATEAGGRIHTSAATVAVLPEAEEVDLVIDEGDLRIDTMRAGGAGGQHVNKTESAVRITHIPSGIVVMVQDERSQHRNKARALSILRSRLYDEERRRLAAGRAEDRKLQVGSGDRSERIRTYNFPQGRVTDHRIDLTLYRLPEIVAGDGLGEIVDALIADHQAALLAAEAA